MSAPYCSVCHANYRGSYAIHQTTAKHLRAVRGPVMRAKSERRQRIARAWRNARADSTPDAERVRKHKRSKPNDGTRRVVPVTYYWRRIGWNRQATVSYGAKPRRRRRRTGRA